MISTDETIRRLERAVAEDRRDVASWIALGATRHRGTGAQPQDDEAVAVWWIHENKIPEDRVHMAARLGYGPAKIACGKRVKKLDWPKWADQKEAIHILEHRESVLLAADFAETVLSIFEARHPNDARPRQAIAAARIWAKSPTAENLVVARTISASVWSVAQDDGEVWARSGADADRIVADAALAAYCAIALTMAVANMTRVVLVVRTAAMAVSAVRATGTVAIAKIRDAQRRRCIHYLLKFPNAPEIL